MCTSLATDLKKKRRQKILNEQMAYSGQFGHLLLDYSIQQSTFRAL